MTVRNRSDYKKKCFRRLLNGHKRPDHWLYSKMPRMSAFMRGLLKYGKWPIPKKSERAAYLAEHRKRMDEISE